jgi:hypothetical protein
MFAEFCLPFTRLHFLVPYHFLQASVECKDVSRRASNNDKRSKADYASDEYPNSAAAKLRSAVSEIMVVLKSLKSKLV